MKESRHRVSIELSPLCRITDFNLAEDLINTGLTTGNPNDWIQQALGIPSTLQVAGLTLDDLKRSMYAPRHDRRSDVILAGIDQGRGSHYIQIVKVSMPLAWKEMAIEEIIENSIQTVLYGAAILKSEILDKLKEYNVVFGLIDNEPDITESSEFARVSCLELADQRSNLLDAYRKGEVNQGGIHHKAWLINNEKFLKQVLNIFHLTDDEGHPLIRIPLEWEKWLGNPSELSPLRHLTSPSYDPDTGQWRRTDNCDDLYYSLMFCEAAFYIWLTEKAKNSTFAAGLGRVKHEHIQRKRHPGSPMTYI